MWGYNTYALRTAGWLFYTDQAWHAHSQRLSPLAEVQAYHQRHSSTIGLKVSDEAFG